MPLDYPELHYVNAASGWIDMNCLEEARGELEGIKGESRQHPEVLELDWRIYAKGHQWDSALSVAERIIERAPQRATGWVDRSYCLHELKRTEEAMDKLLPAFGKFPDEFIIPYNLACYCCQLGDVVAAKSWLERACQRGPKGEVRKMALKDRDLEPMWGEIGNA